MREIGNIISLIRKLAKDSTNQTIYSASKEGSIGLFKNTYDYTYFQIIYLRYLNFYNSINLDIAMNEIGEEVLNREIDEDSYMFWKQNKEKDNKLLQNKKSRNEEVVGGFNWVFKKE